MTKLQLPLLNLAVYLLVGGTSLGVADEPKQAATPAATQTSEKSVDQRLAEARLKLARLELQNAIAANQRTRWIYSATTVELLQSNVNIAEAQLRESLRGRSGDPRAALVVQLETEVNVAQQRYQMLKGLAERTPGQIEASRLETLRTRVEVAQLALAQASDPVHVATPLEYLQWQLDQMRQNVLELTVRIEQVAAAK